MIGSVTAACSTCDSIGRRTPAIAATRELLPATAIPIFFVAMKPREVSMPATRPASRRIPVTSHFWMMSTPQESAARANPQATASWRTLPPRRWTSPPLIGNRAFGEQSRSGAIAWISFTDSHCASMPVSRMALPRRRAASIWASVWVRFTTRAG